MSNPVTTRFLLAFTLLLATACGGSKIDPKSIEGTWHLDSMSGTASSAAEGLRFENSTLKRLGTDGEYACATPYTLDGKHLTTQATYRRGGSCQVSMDVEIESVSADTLVLVVRDARYTYKKD